MAQDARLRRRGRDRGAQRPGAAAGVRLGQVMYRRILVPLEHSPADETILLHVRGLARKMGSAIVLIHVADGWVARNIRELDLRESEEMRDDRAYLEQQCARLTAEGFDADAVLAGGAPHLSKSANGCGRNSATPPPPPARWYGRWGPAAAHPSAGPSDTARFS